MHIWIYIYILYTSDISMNLRICVSMNLCIYVSMHLCIYVCICVYIYVNTYTYIYIRSMTTSTATRPCLHSNLLRCRTHLRAAWWAAGTLTTLQIVAVPSLSEISHSCVRARMILKFKTQRDATSHFSSCRWSPLYCPSSPFLLSS